MAPPSTPVSSLTDRFVAAIFEQFPNQARSLRKTRDTFARNIKHHNYVRTNQFDVAERLKGIEEKFRVLNNDELADALYTRTEKLRQHQEKWLPDVLDLLLHLSHDPIRNSKIEDLENLRVVESVVPPLRWTELERDDLFDRRDPIWRNVAFEGYSSEEDVFVDPIPASPEPQLQDLDEVTTSTEELAQLNANDTDSELDALSEIQFWKSPVTQAIPVSELDVIRETLFALQGLPNALYWRVGNEIELDKRYMLGHCSLSSFRHSLDDFSTLLIRLDLTRHYIGENPETQFLRAFQVGISTELLDFDKYISSLQASILNSSLQGPISLINVLQMVKTKAKVILSIADFLESSKQDEDLAVLEKLFEFVCHLQLLGREEFLFICVIFLKVFDIYFRSVRDWLENRRCLTESIDRVPQFLEPATEKLHLISKTSHVLDEIGQPYHNNTAEKLTIPSMKNVLEPFAETFFAHMGRYIDGRLRAVTARLKEHIGHHLGRGLRAISHIYLAERGPVTAIIDSAVFKRMDKCQAAWNDRFFLTDLVQEAYGAISCIDPSRLSVRVSSTRDEPIRQNHKSVRHLADFSVFYSLPGSTAYIIPEASLVRYQCVSTVLMQVRYAIYVLERRCRFEIRRTDQAFGVCQDLLFFTRTVYDHLTSFAIDTCCSLLHDSLEHATDIDTMTRAHEQFLNDIQRHCFVAERFAPLKDALLAVLDLCLDFSDTVLSKASEPMRASQPNMRARDDNRSSLDEDNNATNVLPPNSYVSSLSRQLRDVKSSFETHRVFFIAGLRGVGRTQGIGWEMLAQKLDWKLSSH